MEREDNARAGQPQESTEESLPRATAAGAPAADAPKAEPSGAESSGAEPPKRRSPTEAFDELKAAINRTTTEISDLWDFAQKVKARFMQSSELQRMEAMLAVLDSLVQVHHILFVHVNAGNNQDARAKSKKKRDKERDKEKERGDDRAFIITLLETVEDELSRHGIEVLEPEPGTAFDVQTMDCSQRVEKNSRKDKPDTVARVNRCGFLVKLPHGPPRLLFKAQVDVFMK